MNSFYDTNPLRHLTPEDAAILSRLGQTAKAATLRERAEWTDADNDWLVVTMIQPRHGPECRRIFREGVWV